LFLVGTDVAGLFLSDFEFLFFNDEEGLNDWTYGVWDRGPNVLPFVKAISVVFSVFKMDS
jgi:hypothetical protein